MKNTCFLNRNDKYRCRLLVMVLSLVLLCSSLTACGPSDEKVTAAQQKYAELTQMHNSVVEAHKLVSDDSLDDSLVDLQGQVTAFESYNLYEMKDEEIDALISDMNTLINSYNEYLSELTEIKAQEDAAVLTTIPVTLINESDLSFSSLSLCEQGLHQTHTNVLENLSSLAPSQILAGLIIQRDVDNTPWVFVLTDENGTEWELPLSVESYTEEGVSLYLSYDSETAELIVTEGTETTQEIADADNETNASDDTEVSKTNKETSENT